MPTQRLLIDGDQGRFFLALQDGALTVGADPANPDLVLRDLRVVRIHCELVVDEASAGHELRLGEALHFGQLVVSLVAAPAAAPANGANVPEIEDLVLAEEDEPAAPAAPSKADPAPSGVCKRLVVIDGADKGRRYPLPEIGTTNIGKSAKHADIVLHDLYVARVHCDVQVEGGRVVVVHREGQNGTLVNGQRVTQQELQVGDVLRVGNSHLRLELDVVGSHTAADTMTDLSTSLSTAHAPRVFASTDKKGEAAGQHAELAAPVDPLAKLENNVLGNYQFGALLGRGHSGLVFRAHHRQNNQPVTVKVLSPEFPSTDAEQQAFIQALKVVAPLRHPHLVTLFAAGKTGLHCWIAREFIDGDGVGTLIERLRKDGKLGWKRACRVAIQIGKVLDFLHQHGVTHGNVSPPNVLIETGSKTTKLADLMLDKALDGSRLSEIIRDRKLLAELPYRAPEQTETGTPVDQRADVYGLGAVVYALLTGQPPFTGTTLEAIAEQVREGIVVKPSRFLRETPAPFEAAVLKMLARSPDDRFQSAADMLDVVESIANIHEIKV